MDINKLKSIIESEIDDSKLEFLVNSLDQIWRELKLARAA